MLIIAPTVKPINTKEYGFTQSKYEVAPRLPFSQIIVRRFEKWCESVRGSIGCEAWGMGGASDFVLRGVVLGSALVLDCTWSFGVGFGRCFVYCGSEGLISQAG